MTSAIPGAELARQASVTIRAARPSDLERVVWLAREEGLLETGIVESFGGFFVAVLDDRIVGACGLEEHESFGLLRTVAVERTARARGIGRGLVQAATARAAERQLQAVYLLTKTAERFFEGAGFVRAPRVGAPAAIQRCWEFRAGCPTSAVLMRRGA